MTYRVLSLFAGIGGFDLGLERTGGFKTVAFCEINKPAQRVLAKHWPEVPIYDDVSELTSERLRADGVAPDFICGGFPCQDISLAGRGAGLEGERSGLFSQVVRLVGELEPRGVLLENVSALLGRGLGDVLRALAEVGYDAEWHCIPASYVGLPHDRDRIWILAYPRDHRLQGFTVAGKSRKVREVAAEQLTRSLEAHAQLSTPTGRMGGRVDGLPGGVDRLKQLGNAVVPQIPELIGRAILAADAERMRDAA